MTNQTPETDEQACDVCGAPSTMSDGICGAELCDNAACLDAAWDRAFSPGETSA